MKNFNDVAQFSTTDSKKPQKSRSGIVGFRSNAVRIEKPDFEKFLLFL